MINFLEKINEIKENKIVKIVGNIIYTLLFILVLLMLIVVVLQRVTDNSLSLMGFRIFSVATGSMLPKYEIGDILISKQVDASTLNVGDDIVYRGEKGSFKNRMITHQIIEMEKQEDGTYKMITKGLANTSADPEITDKQVYGKVICEVGILSFISKAISNVFVFYFVIFIPVAIIVVKQIRAIVNNKDEEDDDKSVKVEKNNKED